MLFDDLSVLTVKHHSKNMDESWRMYYEITISSLFLHFCNPIFLIHPIYSVFGSLGHYAFNN